MAADIAFLAMDLDYHDRQDLSEHLIRAFIGESGDHELVEVLDFYKCYRSYVRGKVESFRLDDPNIPEERKDTSSQKGPEIFQPCSPLRPENLNGLDSKTSQEDKRWTCEI